MNPSLFSLKEFLWVLSWLVAFVIFVLNFPCLGFAEEPYTLEKIVVRANGDSLDGTSLKNNYSVETYTSLDLKEKNLNSVADLLDYVSGIDLRYRGPMGIQGDLSLRGSGFEQVAVLIDGVKVMDPQTGHHNLDIPLTLFDIEKIEVIKEGSSAFYGAGALAGSVNIVTKKPAKKVFNLDTLFGEHALFGQALSLSLPLKDISTRLSFDHKISKAARPNTDFEYNTASFYMSKDFVDSSLEAIFGYQKKDFGADSFYSNLFPEEEEHTETIFIRTGLESRLNFGLLKDNIFFRKHRDKFVLRRNNPASINYHTTYVYGLDSALSLPLKYGEFLLGIDTGRDEINSTNLGKHTRIYEAGSFGFIPDLGDKLTSDLRLRFDHYQKWGWQDSYNFGLGYYILDTKLKVKASVSHAFRIPSFTELYYRDAANIGNPNLRVEESDNFRLGWDYKRDLIFLSLDGYLRRGHNLIDWTRSSKSNPWQATDLGRVDFTGIEFILKLNSGLNFKGAKLERCAFSYNYTHADKKSSGFFSKYALDILKHQFILDMYTAILNLNLDWQLSYNQRYYGENYFVVNLYIAKKIKNKDFTLEPFVRIDNLTNTKYCEVQGVIQPARWIKTGLRFEW
jgi:iron complex outermembrane receptor protein